MSIKVSILQGKSPYDDCPAEHLLSQGYSQIWTVMGTNVLPDMMEIVVPENANLEDKLTSILSFMVDSGMVASVEDAVEIGVMYKENNPDGHTSENQPDGVARARYIFDEDRQDWKAVLNKEGA